MRHLTLGADCAIAGEATPLAAIPAPAAPAVSSNLRRVKLAMTASLLSVRAVEVGARTTAGCATGRPGQLWRSCASPEMHPTSTVCRLPPSLPLVAGENGVNDPFQPGG